MGLVISASASLLAASGRRRAAYRVLTLLIGAAGLEAALGLCLGCKVFTLLMRADLIPEATCETCNDIWSRYPDGRPSPAGAVGSNGAAGASSLNTD